MKQNLFIFGWPSFLGGADTKLAHLIDLLYNEYNITLIPSYDTQLKDKTWTDYLDSFNVKYCKLQDLPETLEGVALSLCNGTFIKNKIYKTALLKGLKVIWSSEMMWMHEGEMEAINLKEIDKLLYVSEIQKAKLNYESFSDIPTYITGNYINPNYFEFKERDLNRFNVGRLSRHDPYKYPENFPQLYEYVCSNIPTTKFRIMAWSAPLKEKYKWFNFDSKWTFLQPNTETQHHFLHSLDIFLYPLGHHFVESWGRSTVEAMLTGAIPIVYSGHHLDNLIINGETGFICDDPYEIKQIMEMLHENKEVRKNMSLACHIHAKDKLCNRAEHIKMWKEALDV